MSKKVLLFAMLTTIPLLTSCADTLSVYLKAAETRQWSGCHCVKVIGNVSATAFASSQGTVNSVLGTGDMTADMCKEIIECR